MGAKFLFVRIYWGKFRGWEKVFNSDNKKVISITLIPQLWNSEFDLLKVVEMAIRKLLEIKLPQRCFQKKYKYIKVVGIFFWNIQINVKN